MFAHYSCLAADVKELCQWVSFLGYGEMYSKMEFNLLKGLVDKH